jgi:ABC-type antimicrobial peptide transport system permease subunit
MALFVPGGIVLGGRDIVTGVVIMVLLGAVTGLFPALRARRLTIIQALGRH